MKNITYNQSNIEDSLVFKDYIQNAWKDSWISMKGYNKMDKDASFNLCISFLFHNFSWTFVQEDIMVPFLKKPSHRLMVLLTFLNLSSFLTFVPYLLDISVQSCCLPDLNGTIPPSSLQRNPLIPDLVLKVDSHKEVALVFVDVLQGFETFVHKTEIQQGKYVTVNKVSTHKHHSKIRDCCWQDSRSSATAGGGRCSSGLEEWSD